MKIYTILNPNHVLELFRSFCFQRNWTSFIILELLWYLCPSYQIVALNNNICCYCYFWHQDNIKDVNVNILRSYLALFEVENWQSKINICWTILNLFQFFYIKVRRFAGLSAVVVVVIFELASRDKMSHEQKEDEFLQCAGAPEVNDPWRFAQD